MATGTKTGSRSATHGDGRSKKRPGPDRQREVIVAAAVDLFIERGSGSVSISDICLHADVGRQTFYRCFTDKDALLTHLYQHAVNAHIESALARLPAEGSAQTWAADMIDQVIDAILAQHKLAQFLYVEAGNPHSLAYQIVERAMDRAATTMRAWFAATLSHRPSKTHLKAILFATTWLVHDAIIAGCTPASVREAKRAARQLFAGLYLATQRAARRAGR